MQKIRIGNGDPVGAYRVASGNDQYFVLATAQADIAEAGGASVGGTSGNVANASAAASLAAAAGLTNYVTGVEFTFSGATAASVVVATVTGLASGTQSFIVAVPAGAAVQGTPLVLRFDPAIPASAVNTAITATLPALGAGNTNACTNIRGFRK